MNQEHSQDWAIPSQQPLPDPSFRIVLIEPEIPQNTGNIGRTCVGLGAELHLVGPMGFQITHTRLKRAGLDYWPHLNWHFYETQEQWRATVSNWDRVFMLSSFAKKNYTQVNFQRGDWLVFGKETKGLPDDLLSQKVDNNLLIPMLGPVRGYNLATAVAIVGFEGLRQISP